MFLQKRMAVIKDDGRVHVGDTELRDRRLSMAFGAGSTPTNSSCTNGGGCQGSSNGSCTNTYQCGRASNERCGTQQQ